MRRLRAGDWVREKVNPGVKPSWEGCYQVACRRGDKVWIVFHGKKYKETYWSELDFVLVTDFEKWKKIY
jgi:predicted small integral membrane protein